MTSNGSANANANANATAQATSSAEAETNSKTKNGPAAITWIWDATHQLYYSPESGTYAYPDPTTGQWVYVPAASFASTSAGTGPGTSVPAENKQTEKEEGEIEDDVGWGGLMEPERLDQALKIKGKGKGGAPIYARVGAGGEEKHPAYGGNTVRYESSSRDRSPSPTKETPNHLLRLVVLSSPSLTPGHLVVIDAREGGIQIGRDRCEKGSHPRVRVREMEVSKTHSVVYWGQGAEGKEGWWVVDLGSTHGTFVTAPSKSDAEEDIDGDPLDTSPLTEPHRLSAPKTSSLPYPLAHMSILSLGKTRFQVHLHESWPCEACQLGRGNEIPIDDGETKDTDAAVAAGLKGNGYAMNSQERRGNREVNRKMEMANLKNSLLNRNPISNPREGTHDGQNRYVDRSALRRQMHPRSPPRVHTSASTPDPVPNIPTTSVSSFAQNMLAAQGWAPGSGLGKDQTGRSEAIEVKMRVEKRGLGAWGAEAVKEDVNEDWRKRAKQRRFEELKK